MNPPQRRDARARVTLASRIWRPEPAAAAFRLEALAKALARAASLRVHTSAAPPQLEAEASKGDSVTPYKILRHRVLRGEDGYLRGYLQYLSFDVPLLFHLLRDATPDIYVCEPPPTTGAMVWLASRLKRRPYAYNAADIWSDAAEGAGVNAVVVQALRVVESFVLKQAATVLAVNDSVADRVRELGGRSVAIVRNGVDTSVFNTEGPPSSLRGTPFFLYAGTMSEWQGAEVFVQAFAQIAKQYPEHRLVFVGQGTATSDIRSASEQAGIEDRVEILPPVSAEKAAAYQRDAVAALVSIKPGIGYDLAFPTKTMAAWACGTPVIYAGPGPARKLIADNGLGWACEYDASVIAQAMNEAAAAPLAEDAIAQWASENVSLSASADVAARSVLTCVGESK